VNEEQKLKRRERDHARYLKNREAVRERQRLYRLANTERIAETKRQWHDANLGRAKENLRRWRAANPHAVTASTINRQLAKTRRTVAWADHSKIRAIYAIARTYRDFGIDCHVDHIIPLRGELVSGLHVEHNLQLLPAHLNDAKGNRYEP